MNFIVFEKGANIFRSRSERQSAELQSSVVSWLKIVPGRVDHLLRSPLLRHPRAPFIIEALSSDLTATTTIDLTLPLLLSLFDFFKLNPVALTRYT
jgi:hypothetical protein